MLPSNCTRTIVCPGFVGPSDPHPRQTFGTSHRRMTGRDAGGPEDAVPLRPPDSGLTPPPVRGLHGLDAVGPGAYLPLSAKIPPARGLHGLDTVGPGVYQFPPSAALCPMAAASKPPQPRNPIPRAVRPDLGRSQVWLIFVLLYIQSVLLVFYTYPPKSCCAFIVR